MNDLIETIGKLAASQISAGVQGFGAARMLVWLGDELEGIEAQRDFSFNDLQAAAQWLNDTACEHYPASDYAQDRSSWPSRQREGRSA